MDPPVVVGPDRDGRTLVLAGDRVGSFGRAPADPPPGTTRWSCPEAGSSRAG